MTTASTLPTLRVTIRFPPDRRTGLLPGSTDESYQLLELPPEILAKVESGLPVPLTIKGRPSDDAVLCTGDTTYLLRTVSISNSLVILRPPPVPSSSNHGTDQTLHIRDICHEVLECVPHAGRTERIRTVLKDSAWGGLGSGQIGRAGRKRKRSSGKQYTRGMLDSVIQASEDELAQGLKENNVVELDGKMLLLPPVELTQLLILILALVTLHASETPRGVDYSRVLVPISEITASLATDHDVEPALTAGVMRLFGQVAGDLWSCDVAAVVRELGRGLLVRLKNDSCPVDDFVADWKTHVGETWSDAVSLELLAGNYLLSDPPASTFSCPSKLLSYFPAHALPSHAPTRFADLFLTRPRWRPDDMAPFLRGLAREGDTKARDKLIAKFVRVVKEKDGAWWYPRRSG